MDAESAAKEIVDAAIKVHRALGPGLLESSYQQCLAFELRKRGLHLECEVTLPINYEGLFIDAGYRVDMIVEKLVLIENKTVDNLAPIHEAQILTYLRMSGIQLGFLINWNVPLLKQGIKRVVHHYPEPLMIKGMIRKT